MTKTINIRTTTDTTKPFEIERKGPMALLPVTAPENTPRECMRWVNVDQITVVDIGSEDNYCIINIGSHGRHTVDCSATDLIDALWGE